MKRISLVILGTCALASAEPKKGAGGGVVITFDNQSQKPICRIEAAEHGGKLSVVLDAKSPSECIAAGAKKDVQLVQTKCSSVDVKLFETIGGHGAYKTNDSAQFGNGKFGGGVAAITCEDGKKHVFPVKDYPAGEGGKPAACCDHATEMADPVIGSVVTVESQQRALGASDKLADKCFAAIKPPTGAPAKGAKLFGKWSCIAAGGWTGKVTLILSPGDDGKVDAAEEQFVDHGGHRTVNLAYEQHGTSLWLAEPGGHERGDLTSGVLKIRQLLFDNGNCQDTKLTCTK